MSFIPVVTSVKAIIGKLTGKRALFAVPAEYAYIHQDLRAHGVEVGDMEYDGFIGTGGHFMFSVPKRQEAYTRSLLESWGYG